MSWMDLDGTTWKSLTLTHVVYPKDDIYGKFLALVSLTPFAIVVAFFTLTLFVRDIHVILFFVGQLLNEIFNTVLKHTFEESRPEQISGKPNFNSSYGWPSSHCQFQTFFATYSTICIYFRLQKLYSKHFINLLIFTNWVLVFFVIHSRLYLRYHFKRQCLDGFIIGFLMAILWYFFVINIEPFIYKNVLKSRFNRYLHLRSIYLPSNIRYSSNKTF